MDLLVVQREHHLRLLGDAGEDRIALEAGDEGQDVRLHDAHLDAGALIDGEDVLDRALRGIHGQVDPGRLHQLLDVQTELVVRSLLRSRDEPHVLSDTEPRHCHEQYENQQGTTNTLRH